MTEHILEHDIDIHDPSTSWLLLVRHTQVSPHYDGICYGASDVELSEFGITHAATRSHELADICPTDIFHSGLTRSQHLAHGIASHTGLEIIREPRIAEVNFGVWELRTWDEIFADVGHDMSRLVHEPSTYAPAGGETAHAVRDRIMEWYHALPRSGRIIAVSHGGAISALLGGLDGRHAREWPQLVPGHGVQVCLSLPK